MRRRVEDAIRALPFRHAGCVRPGFIEPGPGIRTTVRFYQALIENESAVRELGHPVLRALAQELTDKLRKSATINWQNRRSSRARMVAMVKVLLAKHKYPPDKQADATDKVIAQAELLADTWAFEHP